MMSRQHFVSALCLLALLQLCGCSTWLTGNYQDPDLQLVKVEVVKARLLEQHIVLHFRIDNPNDSSLAVRSLTYRVYLGDLLLADGYSEQWFTLAANHSGYFEIPVRTNLWEHLRGLVKLMRHPDQPVPYRLEGELETGMLFGHTLQLARVGEIIPGNFIPEKHR
ncbi:LEA type 2 family protein [Pseudomonas sp. HR96]|uniref:LEA type 2 family protein n=1 Tax=Pseudomonas sp. HR96 TaxID=1027966 RepID=UPI002A74A0BE|nr:LEA type 2 family protein [Pseudomonas sp. HR96]WPO99020.1 LEA type 2 family protein [Pseudomonas sp. HR96]